MAKKEPELKPRVGSGGTLCMLKSLMRQVLSKDSLRGAEPRMALKKELVELWKEQDLESGIEIDGRSSNFSVYLLLEWADYNRERQGA